VNRTDYKGLVFETSSDVYEPADDTYLAADHLIDVLAGHEGESLSVLEMGCGSGLLGMIAAKSENVRSVVFCDKNDRALALARKNCELNEDALKADLSFVFTDLFSGIPESEKFDLMVFNTPYLPRESERLKADETAWDGGEGGIEVADRFLSQSFSRLHPGGEVILVSSSFADLKTLLSSAALLGYELMEERKKHMFFEDIISLLFLKK
jgi:release factor glutamine methyltransferase